jgi:AAA domain-containing protein
LNRRAIGGRSPLQWTDSAIVIRTPPSSFDHRWYAAALKQIAEARWKSERLTVISGPAGAGKTTLCRQVADRTGTRTLAVLVSDPPPTVNELLRAIALEIGALSKSAAATPIGTEDLRHAVREFFSSLASLGADCLVIVDDAHRLMPDAIDEVHALAASIGGRRASTQFVLVGRFDAAIDRPAPLPERRDGPVRPPRPVPLADVPYPVAGPAPALAAPPALAPQPSIASPPAVDASPPIARFTRRRRAAIVAAASLVAATMVWYGVSHRRAPAPAAVTPAQSEGAAARTRAAEAALAAIVAEIDPPADAQRRSIGSTGPLTGALPPVGPGWADEIARRAAILARRPDLPGLLALRSAVAGLHVADGDQSRVVESVLRRLDDTLADARRRQLQIDHRQIAGTGSTNNR